MPVYYRKSTIEDQYGTRRTPDGSILCGGCNRNLADEGENPGGTIFLIYTDKAHLKDNRPYEVYCGECRSEKFPKAKEGG